MQWNTRYWGDNLTILFGVFLKLRPDNAHNYNLSINAVTLFKIYGDQPCNSLLRNNWQDIKNLNLVHPHFDKPESIDLLIGDDLFPYIIQGGRVVGNDNEPVASNSILGCILIGKVLFYLLILIYKLISVKFIISA